MKNARDSVALYNNSIKCFNVLTIKLQINLFLGGGGGDKIFQKKVGLFGIRFPKLYLYSPNGLGIVFLFLKFIDKNGLYKFYLCDR